MLVAGVKARAAAQIVGVHRNTAATFSMRLRRLIAGKLPIYQLCGEVQADEGDFGGVRKGKRGRSAVAELAFFGLLRREATVYTTIAANAKTETLLPIIKQRVRPNNIV